MEDFKGKVFCVDCVNVGYFTPGGGTSTPACTASLIPTKVDYVRGVLVHGRLERCDAINVDGECSMFRKKE